MDVRQEPGARPRLPPTRDRPGELLEAALGAMEDGVLIVDAAQGYHVGEPRSIDELW